MQSQAQTNQNQAQINHATSQAIVKIEIQLGQIAASVGGEREDNFQVKLYLTREDNLFLQMIQEVNLKLAFVQPTTKSRPFTLYSPARACKTKSNFHMIITPIMKISTRRKRKRPQRSEQRKMIKLLTLKKNHCTQSSISSTSSGK